MGPLGPMGPMAKNPVWTQVRNASTGKRKKRITSYRTDMRKFLGPRNFKGLYTKNPFFFAPKDHSTNFMTKYQVMPRHQTNQGKTTDWKSVFGRTGNSTLQPFSENDFCKSNMVLSPELKDRVLQEIANGATPQQVGVAHGIAIPRIEAIVKLNKIEQQFKQQVSTILLLLRAAMRRLNFCGFD